MRVMPFSIAEGGQFGEEVSKRKYGAESAAVAAFAANVERDNKFISPIS